MSYLADYYRECNEMSGHARSCGYGAGADCSCGKIPYCYYEGCEAMGGIEGEGCPECDPEKFPKPEPAPPPPPEYPDDGLPF
jgi:hypothetical protein